MWVLGPVGKEVFFNLEGCFFFKVFPVLRWISLYTFFKSVQVLDWPDPFGSRLLSPAWFSIPYLSVHSFFFSNKLCAL